MNTARVSLPPDLRRLTDLPPSAITGQAAAARDMAAGRFVCPAGEIKAPVEEMFATKGLAGGFSETLHSFGWLADFAAWHSGEALAAQQARRLTSLWLKARRDSLASRPDIIAARLMAWIGHSRLLLDGADEEFQSAFRRALERQTRLLARSAKRAAGGEKKLRAAAALALAAGIGGQRRWAHNGRDLLARELGKQILPDGGHISRNPEAHLRVLLDLTACHAVLQLIRASGPLILWQAIDRMTPMIGFFAHGDGRRAVFHGGGESLQKLAQAAGGGEAQPAAFAYAPHSGYHRLSAADVHLIADTGVSRRNASGGGYDYGQGYAGALAFEMSDGGDRLVVNCGPGDHLTGPWPQMLKSAAAHSSLTIAGRPVWPERAGGDSMPQLISAAHDGYLAYGLRHQRQMFLSPSGVLRGEDKLFPPPRSWARTLLYRRRLKRNRETRFAVRFHLHPDVSAALLRGGRAVLLRLPSGRGWRFDMDGLAALRLEDSVYSGERRLRRTRQIVLEGYLSGISEPAGKTDKSALAVRWQFRRTGIE